VLAVIAWVPDHRSVRVLLVLAGLLVAVAVPRSSHAELPRESPLYGSPYRRGLAAEVAVGVALCQPAPIYAGVCGPRGGSPAIPGVALRLGLGWRFNSHWYLSGAWIRQGHRPGGSFTSGLADGGMLAVRGIVPLPTVARADSRVDLGFELGLGWSQRELIRDAAPLRLSSNGAVLRPALVLEGWVLADLAIGLELATQLNFHWQYCADELCEAAPGPWIGSDLEHRWVNGFSVAVRATGLLYPRL
jgi:hypothetical protein